VRGPLATHWIGLDPLKDTNLVIVVGLLAWNRLEIVVVTNLLLTWVRHSSWLSGLVGLESLEPLLVNASIKGGLWRELSLLPWVKERANLEKGFLFLEI
jgi:hypothetical protein